MAALLFCVCLILKLTLVAGQPAAVHYVLKGKEAVLSPGLPKDPDDILWKHNGDKVITFDSAEEHTFPPYEGRVTLGWNTAELKIADVGYEDSGEYELDALIRNKLYRSQYMLKVLDYVSKPVIRCEMNDESGNSTSVRGTLHCSSDSNTPEALTFKWNLEGKSHLGQTLTIALGDEHDHIEYSCTANNLLHAETSVFTAKDCLTAGRSSKALDVIVPIVIASLILLAFCLFPFIFRHQIKRACFRREKNDDLEKQITVAGDIHRQETFASKQPLIQQNEEASPQRQEINKELEEVKLLERVKKSPKKITNQEENDTDSVETATPQPASPIRPGLVDLEGETDNNAPKTEGDRDTDYDHSSNGFGQTETQALLSKSDEHESRGQTQSTREPDADHPNHEDVQKSNLTGDSSSIHSGGGEAAGSPEQAGLAESNEQSKSIESERKEQLSLDEAPEDKDPHGDLEKQKTVADEDKPHIQQNEEASSQQQEEENDTDSVETATPQPASPITHGLVDLEGETDNNAPKTEGDRDTDSDQTETQALLSKPDEHESEGQTNSIGESDADHSDREDVQKSDVAGDFSSIHSGQEEAPEQAAHLHKSEPQEDALQFTNKGLAESNEVFEPTESKVQVSPNEDSAPEDKDPQRDASHNENVNSVHIKAKESEQSNDSQMPPPLSELSEPQHPSDPQSGLHTDEDSQPGPIEDEKTDSKLESNTVDQETQKEPPRHDSPTSQPSAAESEESGLTNEQQSPSATDSESSESPPQPVLQHSPVSVQGSKPDPEPELEDRGKTSPVEQREPDPADKDRQGDSDPESVSSDNKSEKAEDAAPDVPSPSPDSQSLESQPVLQHPVVLEDKETGPVEQTKPDPVDNDPQGDSDHESVTSDNKPTDVLSSSPGSPAVDGASSQSDQNQHPHSGPNAEEVSGDKESDSSTDSSSKESEESKQTSTTEITPTGKAEQPGSEKEPDESTHPPASALSKHAHNKGSKDTDAENASSAQVSEETKDNTDKESDSSGSEQINEPTQSKEGRQQT